MQADHPRRRGVTGGISIETAVDLVTRGEQPTQPGWIGAHAGGREADVVRVELATTDGIDGGLAEHDAARSAGADPEISLVLARAGRQPAPDLRPSSPQFGTDRPLCFACHQQKHGIAPVVRVQPAGGPLPRCCSSHSTAVQKSTAASRITRSIAPRPPLSSRQIMNLAPVTDSGPCSLRHLRRSRRSRSAPRQSRTDSKAISRTRAARSRKSSKLMTSRWPRRP